MSGICGELRRDGAPADRTRLGALMARADHRGPDGRGVWIAGPIALGHHLLATTPEAVGEQQPHRDEARDLTLVLDGRLDRRSELCADLASRGFAPTDATDAALLLAAYACWGHACLPHLHGDFALALFDGGRRELLLARDVSGIKPLYVHVGDKVLVFGSELAQVLAHPEVPARIDEGMVGELLGSTLASKEGTLYRDIRRLPPATSLRVAQRRVVRQRYWEVDPGRVVRHARFEDYVEEFMTLLGDAVADRLRCTGRPSMTLSGGLDSSIVAGLAQRVLRAHAPSARLQTFSLTVPGSPIDETRWIRAVQERWNLESHLVPHADLGAPDYPGQVKRTRELPDFPTTTLNADLRARAVACDARVLLSGVGGSTRVSGSAFPYVDLLRPGTLDRAMTELRTQAASVGWRTALLRLVGSVAWSSSPPSLRRRVARRKPIHVSSPFLAPAFQTEIRLADRLHDGDDGVRWRSLGDRDVHRRATSASGVYVAELEDRANADAGLEDRHPFHDRRLFEFLMAVPEDARGASHEDRPLIRRAGPAHIPEAVATRRQASEYSLCVDQALGDAAVQRTLTSLTIAERGWVDASRVGRALEKTRKADPARGIPGIRPPLPLWMVFAVETWHREIFG